MSLLNERENLAGTEGARRASGVPASRDMVVVSDPEVSEKAKRHPSQILFGRPPDPVETKK